jgi:ppGpp synthetase/RelA/SpoT-type nucleotidyltranferase
MKIPGSIRDAYYSRIELYKSLKEKVDNKISSFLDPRWHFESRIKREESFALKVETGRCDNIFMVEDFFACTIVVDNQNEIVRALDLIKKCGFVIKERRPRQSSFTHKRPDSFPFDDLRIYVEWHDPPALKPTLLNGTIFEIQIKTYLQHAWAIATHDLVYKSDSVSWPSKRIAFQIKAMLEHAEVAISAADLLSDSESIRMVDKNTKKISAVISVMKKLWDASQLPGDLTRFAETVNFLISSLDISITRLKEILNTEASAGRGHHLKNLSPYGIVVQSIARVEPEKFWGYVSGVAKEFKVVITKEIDFGNLEVMPNLTNAILIE